MLHLHQQFFELQCFIAYESKTYLQCFIVLHWKLFCRVDTTMLEFQSKYFPCIKQASRFAMFHCTWIEPCLAGLACTHSSLSNYIRLPHFMCCSVCRTMFDSAYTYNDKNLKLTSLSLIASCNIIWSALIFKGLKHFSCLLFLKIAFIFNLLVLHLCKELLTPTSDCHQNIDQFDPCQPIYWLIVLNDKCF